MCYMETRIFVRSCDVNVMDFSSFFLPDDRGAGEKALQPAHSPTQRPGAASRPSLWGNTTSSSRTPQGLQSWENSRWIHVLDPGSQLSTGLAGEADYALPGVSKECRADVTRNGPCVSPGSRGEGPADSSQKGRQELAGEECGDHQNYLCLATA